MSEPSKSLFGLGEEFERLRAMIEDQPDEEIDERLAAYLDDLNVSIERKIEAYCTIIREREALALARRVEAKRVDALAQTDENFVGRMRNRLREFMERTGQPRIETARHKLAIRNNGGKLPIEIIGDVPPEFCKIEYRPDRDKIREEIMSRIDGADSLPFARIGERGKCLVIQ